MIRMIRLFVVALLVPSLAVAALPRASAVPGGVAVVDVGAANEPGAAGADGRVTACWW